MCFRDTLDEEGAARRRGLRQRPERTRNEPTVSPEDSGALTVATLGTCHTKDGREERQQYRQSGGKPPHSKGSSRAETFEPDSRIRGAHGATIAFNPPDWNRAHRSLPSPVRDALRRR